MSILHEFLGFGGKDAVIEDDMFGTLELDENLYFGDYKFKKKIKILIVFNKAKDVEVLKRNIATIEKYYENLKMAIAYALLEEKTGKEPKDPAAKAFSKKFDIVTIFVKNGDITLIFDSKRSGVMLDNEPIAIGVEVE
jgi:hypothetical protein